MIKLKLNLLMIKEKKEKQFKKFKEKEKKLINKEMGKVQLCVTCALKTDCRAIFPFVRHYCARVRHTTSLQRLYRFDLKKNNHFF